MRKKRKDSKEVKSKKQKQQSLPSPCAKCGAQATSQCKCGVCLCSPGKNPQCYFNHSQDMLNIETQKNVVLPQDRHPVSGVNPTQFMGDSANQGQMYGQESGNCVKCHQEVTKRCKHCSVFVCRPTENSKICMAAHLKEKHKIEPVFWIT